MVEEVHYRANRIVIAAVRGGGTFSAELQFLSIFVTVDRLGDNAPSVALGQLEASMGFCPVIISTPGYQLRSLLQDTKMGYDEAFHRRWYSSATA